MGMALLLSRRDTHISNVAGLTSHGARLYNAVQSGGVDASLGVSRHWSIAFVHNLCKTQILFLCLSFLFLWALLLTLKEQSFSLQCLPQRHKKCSS